MKEHAVHIQGIKDYMIQKLESSISGVEFNGDAKGRSLYTVLNVMFPPTEDAEMLLMKLDISGVACSAGSACTSGSLKGSHVIEALGIDVGSRPVIRFSFSKYNTKAEVDFCVDKLVAFFKQPVSA
jgi:cysteine desulfurase